MKQIGNVCVDYNGGQFGDLIRLFISQHDGFERFAEHRNYGNIFPLIQLYPGKCMELWKPLQEQLDKLNPKHRHVYKILSKQTNLGIDTREHSTLGVQWARSNYINDYNKLRGTNDYIIFLKLNPMSKYKDTYLERHQVWSNRKANSDIHLKEWTWQYFNREYPQHKLNLELDVDEILDLNEDAYIELCKFIKVKPLMNWRDYINEYKDYVKIGRTL